MGFLFLGGELLGEGEDGAGVEDVCVGGGVLF